MVENSASSVCSSVSRFCRTRGSGAFTSTLSKNRSTLGRSDAMIDAFDRLARAMRRYFVVEFALRVRLRAALASIAPRRPSNLACSRMLRMRLKLAASGSKSRWAARPGRASRRSSTIEQIVPAGGQDGVDFVVLEAADIAEVVADAVGEERLQAAASPPQKVEQRQSQLAFDQDLDHALRGAAQRERDRASRWESGRRGSSRAAYRACRPARRAAPVRLRGIESSMLTGL